MKIAPSVKRFVRKTVYAMQFFFVFGCVFAQVIVWGPCGLDAATDASLPPEIKPCSSILDVGDSATAVSFCPVFCADNR